jgi:hypothetical protein
MLRFICSVKHKYCRSQLWGVSRIFVVLWVADHLLCSALENSEVCDFCNKIISRLVVSFFYTSTILYKIRCLNNVGFNRLESTISQLFFLFPVSILLNPPSGDRNLPVELMLTRRSHVPFLVETENRDRGALCGCVCMCVCYVCHCPLVGYCNYCNFVHARGKMKCSGLQISHAVCRIETKVK